MFRHTYAKILDDKGVEIECIKKYMNHKTMNMTAGYINHSTEEKADKFKRFVEVDRFEGHAKEKADTYKKRLSDAFENKEFQGMTVSSQVELLEMISGDMEMNIQIMDHGICFLPNLTQCPHNYTDINSCIEEHCDKFVTTPLSIPYLEKQVHTKTKFVEELKTKGFNKAYKRNKDKLLKTESILKGLKEDE
jgi:hypothetical protein